MKKTGTIAMLQTMEQPYKGIIVKSLGGMLGTLKAGEPLNTWTLQHLYLLSKEEVVEGDYFMTYDLNGNASDWELAGKVNGNIVSINDGGSATIHKMYITKIVATTNKTLGLPLLTPDFVEEYCWLKGNIGEVDFFGWYPEIETGSTKSVLYMHIDSPKDKMLREIAESKYTYTDLEYSLSVNQSIDMERKAFIEGIKWAEANNF